MKKTFSADWTDVSWSLQLFLIGTSGWQGLSCFVIDYFQLFQWFFKHHPGVILRLSIDMHFPYFSLILLPFLLFYLFGQLKLRLWSDVDQFFQKRFDSKLSLLRDGYSLHVSCKIIDLFHDHPWKLMVDVIFHLTFEMRINRWLVIFDGIIILFQKVSVLIDPFKFILKIL